MELIQYKNLLRITDINEGKNTQFTSVAKEFMDTKIYIREQMNMSSVDKGFDEKAWKKALELSDVEIGPVGQLRTKLIKTSFKVILKYIIPDQLAYVSYMAEFPKVATKRDLGFMKKLTKLELEHYLDEKGFQGLDRIYAMCEFDDNEIELFEKYRPTMLRYREQSKDLIYELLKIKKKIFDLAIEVDNYVKEVNTVLRPKTTAKFVQNFYRDQNAT